MVAEWREANEKHRESTRMLLEGSKEAQAAQKLEESFLAHPQLAQEVRDYCTRIREREKIRRSGDPP